MVKRFYSHICYYMKHKMWPGIFYELRLKVKVKDDQKIKTLPL